MFVFEQLTGEVAAGHGEHDFPRAALRQGVEAAQQYGLFVEDDDFLVHHVDLNNGVQDGPKLGQVLLVLRLALQGVAGVADEHEILTPLPAPAARVSLLPPACRWPRPAPGSCLSPVDPRPGAPRGPGTTRTPPAAPGRTPGPGEPPQVPARAGRWPGRAPGPRRQGQRSPRVP